MPNVALPEILVILIFIALMILVPYAAIVLLARDLHRVMPATTTPRDPALDALRVRFANGDIDQVEVERLRSVLWVN